MLSLSAARPRRSSLIGTIENILLGLAPISSDEELEVAGHLWDRSLVMDMPGNPFWYQPMSFGVAGCCCFFRVRYRVLTGGHGLVLLLVLEASRADPWSGQAARRE
jgi:hypothetical protein